MAVVFFLLNTVYIDVHLQAPRGARAPDANAACAHARTLTSTFKWSMLTDCWTKQENKRAPGGRGQAGITTLSDCKAACVAEPTCVAINVAPMNVLTYCFLLLSITPAEDFTGVAHYILSRDCSRKLRIWSCKIYNIHSLVYCIEWSKCAWGTAMYIQCHNVLIQRHAASHIVHHPAELLFLVVYAYK